MKALAVAVLALALGWPALAGEVYVIPLRESVSKAQFFFLRRALKDAEQAGAKAVILDMDTYGGELNAAVDMSEALSRNSVPTITYVNRKAVSAGALIALATGRIYMAPVSAIGAAAPVMGGGENLPSTMQDKATSFSSGYFRSAAERNGHNPDIAEAFINKEKEVKIGEEMVHAKGSVLTLSAQEAVKVHADKPLLAAGIAESIEEVARLAGFEGMLKTVEPSGFERVAFWITALAPVFLLVGIVGIYLEFKMQGALVPGIIGVSSLLVFFTGHYLAGLTGLEVVALFLAGLLLVLVDLFLFPGTFIMGSIGAAMVLGSLFWAMIDRYPGGGFWPAPDALLWPMINLAIAMLAAAAIIMWLAKYLPRTSLYNRFALSASNPPGPSFSPATVASPQKVHVGDEGVSRSDLRPSGNAAFGEVVVDVVTRGEYVERQTPIRVLAVEGSRIVVGPS